VNYAPTPRWIAFLSAALIALVSAILGGFMSESVTVALVIFIVSGTFGSAIIYFFLQRFIYDKIKLIYKNIHRLNTQHLDDKSTKLDPISSVSEDVFSWANERREEIALLKKQETFRREFIGNISHELKTPIFQIQGYVHTLLEGALSDPDVNYRFLSKAANSADRLVELVSDLTSISLLESGSMELNLVKFDVHTVVVEVYDELDYLKKEKKCKLRFKENADKHLMVRGDKSRIKQVLTNLIMNAIKYGRENGEIKVGIYDMDGYVLVEVTDDGEGIPQESQPRLFERFYRVEKSRNREAGGSGLGLSIAKHIVEAHGQSIHVRSATGHGSTFSFTLKKAK